MSFKTFVIGYGDEQGIGRGIYSVHVADNALMANLAYACTAKPGAMIMLGSRLYLSYQENAHVAGILVFAVNEQRRLTFLSRHEIPCFITSFSQINENHLLGSSFYHAVDVMLKITETIEVTHSVTHSYRPRSSDKRQASPHPHHINVMDDGLHAYSVDMGMDFVSLYSIADQSLTLIKELMIDCPVGSGPRIMRISSDNKFAYLLNEISNSISVYSRIGFNAIGKDGLRFEEIQRITTLCDETDSENSAAGCALSSDGHYLLVTNRGENTLVLFRVDPRSGALTLCDRIQTGLTPRDICLTSHQIIVACQGSNTLQLFHIDTKLNKLRLSHQVDHAMAPIGFLN